MLKGPPRAVRLHCRKRLAIFPVLSQDVTITNSPWPGIDKKNSGQRRVWLVTSRLPFFTVLYVPRWYHRKGLGLIMLYILTFISLILKFSKRTFKFLSRAIYLIISNEKYALEDGVYGILSFYWLAQINLMKNLPKSSTNRILKPMREFAI